MKNNTTDYDAIVIGSGISGGWAAKELTEKGLKVLVLERGKDIKHGLDYRGEHAPTWKFPFHGKPDRQKNNEDYPIQSESYAFSEATKHFFNNDKKNPYVRNQDKPFDWMRADVVGGRSLIWGRQVYRFNEQDFKPHQQDQNGIDWPIEYKDLAPWYSHVEKFIGVSGQKENLPELPDSEFLPPMKMFALEKTIKKRLASKAPEVTMTMGRCAILTENHNGRAACHYCGPCHRGCSTGGYFSSQSSTLPAAKATGNLTIKADSVVEKLIYDKESGKVSSVQVVDVHSKKRQQYSAKLFFMCASTVASTQILLNSKSDSFPNGLANSSGTLGHFLMDHAHGSSAVGFFLDDMDSYYFGNRPNGTYIPRFKNLDKNHKEKDFVRGYGYQGHVVRSDWRFSFNSKGFGASYKESLRKPGPWIWSLTGFAECLPQKNNKVTLDENKQDSYGIPQVAIEFEWGNNEKALWKDAANNAERLMKAAGSVFSIKSKGLKNVGGSGIHEMGTARMGSDPTNSVLNKHNQAHDVANLFVTDGACMTSSSCVNPSLTYMALTARACDYAVKQLADGHI